MDLRGIANGLTRAVSPNVRLTIQVSTGYTTAANGKRTPTYADPVTMFGQVQPLSNAEIAHLDSLNIQGVKNAIYISGRLSGLVREENKGGDLITMPDGTIWLVSVVFEDWPTWVRVGVTRQNPASG